MKKAQKKKFNHKEGLKAAGRLSAFIAAAVVLATGVHVLVELGCPVLGGAAFVVAMLSVSYWNGGSN